MAISVFKAVLLLLATAPVARMQLAPSCNPTENSCPPVPAIGTTTTISFDSDHSLGLFTEIAGLVSFAPGSTGLILSIAKGNDTPTIQLSKYIFSGRVDVVMRAALGASIVTSFAMQSGTLDEIAFELVGVDGSQTQTNYFSKGCNHTAYSIQWTPERIDWMTDGIPIRALLAKDRRGGCDGFPQTPMKVMLGARVAGKSAASPSNVGWVGGLANLNEVSFQAFIKSIKIADNSNDVANATRYRYGNQSGMYSIIVETAQANTTEPAPAPQDSEVPPHADGGSIYSSSGAPSTEDATRIVIGTIIGCLFIVVFVSALARLCGKKNRAVSRVDGTQNLDEPWVPVVEFGARDTIELVGEPAPGELSVNGEDTPQESGLTPASVVDAREEVYRHLWANGARRTAGR